MYNFQIYTKKIPIRVLPEYSPPNPSTCYKGVGARVPPCEFCNIGKIRRSLDHKTVSASPLKIPKDSLNDHLQLSWVFEATGARYDVMWSSKHKMFSSQTKPNPLRISALPIPMLTPNFVHRLKWNSFGFWQKYTNKRGHEQRGCTIEQEQPKLHRT